MRIYAAEREGKTVAMNLWLADGDRAYYHLGAANETGYETRANFALFDRALSDFAEEGMSAALLGAGAGVSVRQDDGLARFKAGWANETRVAFLCGIIFDHAQYERLAPLSPIEYFPAYRASEVVPTPTAQR